MTTIPEVVQTMQEVLTTVADQVARETGFVRRESKLGGAEFAQTLVFGFLANPQASLEELSQTAATLGVCISPQGLDDRFTPAAAACLQNVLAAAVERVIAAEPVAIPILQRFAGVYVRDSTLIGLPDALAEVWPGCSGAALKVEVQWDLTTGAVAGLGLFPGRVHDRTAAAQGAALPPGALALADLGYFSLEQLADDDARGVLWLTRVRANTVAFDAADRRGTLLDLLTSQSATVVDQPIRLGAQQRLACRLLAGRVPQEVADNRRRRLRAEARRRGQALSAERLALADWTVLVTNVPPERLSVADAWVVARARWQIECLFRLWKSHGHLDESRSAKPWHLLTEVYAKLLAQLVQHWLFLVTCWCYPDRSLRKAAQTVQKHALHLAAVFAHLPQLVEALRVLQRCFAAGCRINKRKANPHTFQLLLGLTGSALA